MSLVSSSPSDVGPDHRQTVDCQPHGGRLADAGGRTGDDGDGLGVEVRVVEAQEVALAEFWRRERHV